MKKDRFLRNLKNSHDHIEYIVCKPVQFSIKDIFTDWSLGSLIINGRHLSIYIGENRVAKIPMNLILSVRHVKKKEEFIHISYIDGKAINKRILLAGPSNIINKIYEMLTERIPYKRTNTSCIKLSEIELKILFLLHSGVNIEDILKILKIRRDKLKNTLKKLYLLRLVDSHE